jgi:hypothetical protein
MLCKLVITLPPGPLEDAILRRLLEDATGERGWIRPTSYGSGEPDENALGPGNDVVQALAACVSEHGEVTFEESGAGMVIMLPDRHTLSYAGTIQVVGEQPGVFGRLTGDPTLVSNLLSLVRSPFAYAAREEAATAFKARWVPNQHGGETRVPTVRGGYSRGLEHPHWRMWFGQAWTDFLGRDHLAAAPAVVSRPVGDHWFVQVHEDPGDWDDPEGMRAADRFAGSLGKTVFYDPRDPERVLAAPDFSHLMQAAKTRYPHLREISPPPKPGT